MLVAVPSEFPMSQDTQAPLQFANLRDLDVSRQFERLAVVALPLFLVVLGKVREDEDVGVLALGLRYSGFGLPV